MTEPVMSVDEEQEFRGLLGGTTELLSYFNRKCGTVYRTYLEAHLKNRPLNDEGNPTRLRNRMAVGYVASNIEILDVGLRQRLVFINRIGEHSKICLLFAKATFDGHCPV